MSIKQHRRNWQLYGIIALSLSLGLFAARPAAASSEQTIYSFPQCGLHTGSSPIGTPLVGPNHSIYSVTEAGGSTCAGDVVMVSPPTSPGGTPTSTDIHDFGLTGDDGATPIGGVIADKNGVLYGATTGGGTSSEGVAYSLTPPATPGGPWIETILHQFTNGADGGAPSGPLVLGSKGELFGLTFSGGAHGTAGAQCGVAYMLTPPAIAGGVWTETVLFNFGLRAADGSTLGAPTGGLTAGPNGILFGATNSSQYFAIKPPVVPGGPWRTGTIFSNPLLGSPTGDLLFANQTLYGPSSSGTVFSLTPPPGFAGTWIETDLHTFAGTPDGDGPVGRLAIDRKTGVLYGATSSGGSNNEGADFSLTPPATAGGSWDETVLYSFDPTARNDGAHPSGGLAFCGKGVLCGLTNSFGGSGKDGTLYVLKP